MANRCHFQCCLQVCLQLLPSHGPGSHELKIFSVKIMQPIAKKEKSLIKIPKLNLPNHNHRKERHKNLPTWPFSGLIHPRDPPTYSFFSIPWKTTEKELKQHFSKFGNIVFCESLSWNYSPPHCLTVSTLPHRESLSINNGLIPTFISK